MKKNMEYTAISGAQAAPIPNPPGGGSWTWTGDEWVSNDPAPQPAEQPAEQPVADQIEE